MANDSSSGNGQKARLAGWPFENYAVNLRRWNTGLGDAGNVSRVAIATPRHKHTFFVEFVLGPGVSKMITNVANFIEDETIYAHVKSVDLPKPTLATDTLRSYNRNYKIQKKMEFAPFSIRFYDDSTSMVMALVKDALNFVSYSGEIGSDFRNNRSSAYMAEFNKFSYNHTGPAAMAGGTGDVIRSGMQTRPSLGMRLRECSRMFFESIIVYDLGTEPDSVNVYTYMNPVLVGVDPEARDYAESGVAEVTMAFEYEDYSFTVGQPKNQFKFQIDHKLGKDASPHYPELDGHAELIDTDLGPDPTCVASCGPSGGISTFVPGIGRDAATITLGDYIAPPVASIPTIGPDGQPMGAQAIDPRTGLPIDAVDFGNSAPAALTYYQDQLQRAVASYAQVSGRGILSPQVEQYRRQQIVVLTQQVAAVSAYQNATTSGNILPFGIDTNTATINSARILLNGALGAIGADQVTRQLLQNDLSARLINSRRIALEAQATAEDISSRNSLAQQPLAKNQAENAQFADDAEFHRQQAVQLRAQAGALTAPPQFPTYIPEASAGGSIDSMTRAVALQAIGNFLTARRL